MATVFITPPPQRALTAAQEASLRKAIDAKLQGRDGSYRDEPQFEAHADGITYKGNAVTIGNGDLQVTLSEVLDSKGKEAPGPKMAAAHPRANERRAADRAAHAAKPAKAAKPKGK